MKKVLLASTALVLTGGFAAAEVTVSGGGVLGFKYGPTTQAVAPFTTTTTTTTTTASGTNTNTNTVTLSSTTDDRMTLHYELDFGISGSTETDGGLGISASFDLDLDDGATASMINDPEIKFTFGGGSISFGQIASAMDVEVPNLPDVGFDGIGADDDTEAAFDKGTYNVLATFDFGMGSISASADIDDSSSGAVVGGASGDVAIAASFDVAGITVGVGYEEANGFLGGSEILAIGLSGEAAGFGYNVFYHQADTGALGDVSTIGVAGTFDIDSMTSVTAVVGMNEDVSSDNDFSVGIARSLGGGVSFKAGVGSINGDTVADAGFTFDF